VSSMKLIAADLVSEIMKLPKNRYYHYVNPNNPGIIKIDQIFPPEGPIYIKRCDPSAGESIEDAAHEPISTEMLARVANAFAPGHPINFDRVLGASYNTRSVLEALIAHTPQFWWCRPGRIDSYTGLIRRGHKHLIWLPNDPHKPGIIEPKETDIVISEMAVQDASYDALTVPEDVLKGKIDINTKRRHTQIQVALITIGRQFNFRTWIAIEDQEIIYNDRRLIELEGVIKSLADEPIISAFEAVQAAQSIDTIWFGNRKYMPAVMEVEDTTNIKSGLDRMEGLKDKLPSVATRYVIVADDTDRGNVTEKANLERFRHLNARYFPYSAVEELYILCQRRKIRGVTQEFLDAYMEQIVV